MGAHPGSELAQVHIFVETAAYAIRAANAGDTKGLQSAMHQLNNIAQGWLLSAELRQARMAQQMRLEMKLPEEGSTTE